MAKSLAFWLEKSNANGVLKVGAGSKVELHFNYWLINGELRDEVNYLDVGVRFNLERCDGVDFLCVYFPFLVGESEYQSGLGSVVCGDNELTSAIFNTPVESRKSVGEKVELKFSNEPGNKLVFHCQIEAGSDPDSVRFNKVKVSDGSVGTIIKFPMSLFSRPKSSESGFVVDDYFRFRLKLSKDAKETLSQVYRPADRYLNLRHEVTEVVDFRVNEVRNLPARIRDKLVSGSCISCIHFFIIRDADSEHKLSHKDFKRCRVLENDVWNGYLDGVTLNDKNQMLIYHWSEKAGKKEKVDSEQVPLFKRVRGFVRFNNSVSTSEYYYINNFSAFAKFTKTKSTYNTILVGLVAVVVFGIASGVLGNYIYAYLPKLDDGQEKVVNVDDVERADAFSYVIPTCLGSW